MLMQNGDPEGLNFFNRNAFAIGSDSREYRFDENDFQYINESNYWHSKTDPSSGLCASTVYRGRNRFGKQLTRKEIIKLCAATLNITPQKLEDSLNWTANYMAFHDGTTVEENHPYLPNEP